MIEISAQYKNGAWFAEHGPGVSGRKTSYDELCQYIRASMRPDFPENILIRHPDPECAPVIVVPSMCYNRN